MIELKFTHEEPGIIRADMAAMLGVSLADPLAQPAPVQPTGGGILSPETAKADAEARAEGKNIDGSERRETRTRKTKAADKPASIVADVVQPTVEPFMTTTQETTAQTIEATMEPFNGLNRFPKIEPQPNISANPENREPAPLTLDDVRNAAMAYVRKFKLEMKDAGQELAKCLLDTPEVGKGKISELDPADQAQLAAAVAAFVKATAADKRYGQ